MNTPNNKRRKESQNRMERAFIRLLQNQELEQLSVTAICREANVNRTTFYANYTDMHNLAEAVGRRLEQEVQNLYQSTKDRSYSSDNFLKLFQHIKDAIPDLAFRQNVIFQENIDLCLAHTFDQIIKKFKSAVNDSEAQVAYREGKDGINNLMSIYSAFTGKDYAEIEKEFDGKGYGDFKAAVGETVADCLQGVRARYAEIIKDKAYIEEIMLNGKDRASYLARKMLSKVYRKVGFYGLK